MSSWLGFRVKEEAHFVAESGIGKIQIHGGLKNREYRFNELFIRTVITVFKQQVIVWECAFQIDVNMCFEW